MLKLAVIGKDVSKSDSPAIHNFILGKFGVACSYDAISIPPHEFTARAEELFQKYDAFNVTIPFKADILPYLKELKGDAPAFGVVNTVLCRERVGYNTDGYGFLTMLETENITVKGKTVLVLGAGGAGRSCIKKLTEAGAEVFAYERNAERLQEVFQEFGGFIPCSEIEERPYDIIINCTGVGMHNTVGQSPVGERLLSLCTAAVDLIYVPAESEFLRIARSLGKKTVNGAAMLFYQAYLADCIYTDRAPSTKEAKALWNEFRR